MSVTGEFQRVLRDCAAFLHGCGPDHVPGPAESLEAAALEGGADLARAATQALEALEEARNEPRSFASDLQREEFARLADHAEAICRVVLGG